MAIVGYWEGTELALLSKLYAQGYAGLPLGNGVDDYGRNLSS